MWDVFENEGPYLLGGGWVFFFKWVQVELFNKVVLFQDYPRDSKIRIWWVVRR